MRVLPWIFTAIMTLASAGAMAETPASTERKPDANGVLPWLDGRFNITGMVGHQFFDHDFPDDTHDEVAEAVSAGYLFKSRYAVELRVLDGGMASRGHSLNGLYRLDERMGRWEPFLLAQISRSSIKTAGIQHSDTEVGFGVGAFWKLNECARLRGEIDLLRYKSATIGSVAPMLGIELAECAQKRSTSPKPSSMTPAYVSMPEPDADSDGVMDALDHCPQTPQNITVDSKGCPLDSDQDGTPDFLDICAATSYGAAVNDSGCQPDLDQDGMPDAADKCPDSSSGTVVDGDGCDPHQDKQALIEVSIFFATGKANIHGDALAAVQKVAKFMRRYPETRVAITGHADSRGSPEGNQRLSRKRAETIMRAIVAEGIDASHLSASGYGPEKPIASNSTAAGRIQNRRAVITTKPIMLSTEMGN